MPEALITGSASGIGLAVTCRLLAKGWGVTGVDRLPRPEGLGGGYTHCRVDLLDTAALAAACGDLERASYKPTALVHCAGIMRSDDDSATRADGGVALWRLHVLAAHTLIESLSSRMPANAGRIVLVSSRAARGRAGRALYAGSKAALDGLARSWASALLRAGITVNVVAPASTNTPMLNDPARAGVAVLPLPIGRLIEPEDVADVVDTLLGRAGGVITGQTILIDGGVSLGS